MSRPWSAAFLALGALVALSACELGTIDTVDSTPGRDDGAGSAPDTGDAGDGSGPPTDAPAPDEPAPPPPPPPAYQLEVGDALEGTLELGQSTQFTVTVTSQNGFDGPVSLAVAGAPASWVLTFDPAETVELSPDAATDVVVSIDVPTDGEAAEAMLVVTSEADLGPQTGELSVTVLDELTIAIGADVGEGQHEFPGTTVIRPGTTVKFVNADSVDHRIHSNRDNDSFPHQQGRLNPGETYAVTPVAPDNYNFYCHIHEVGAGVGRLQVVEPATDEAE